MGDEVFIMANNIKDLVMYNNQKVLANTMQFSDLATMNAEEKKLKELYKDFDTYHKVLKSKCLKTFRMCSDIREEFIRRTNTILTNNDDQCNNTLTQSKTKSKVSKKHESEELVDFNEDCDDKVEKNNHSSNVINEIQEDADPDNPDVSKGYDSNDEEGPTQPKKDMKSRKEDNEFKRVELQPTKAVTKVYKCNDCNYTTGKKYLLLRHGKKHSENFPGKNTARNFFGS